MLISKASKLNYYARVLSSPLSLAASIIAMIALTGGTGVLTGTALGYTFLGLGAGQLALTLCKVPATCIKDPTAIPGEELLSSSTWKKLLASELLSHIGLTTLGALAAFGVISLIIPAWFIIAVTIVSVIVICGWTCKGFGFTL